MKKTIVFCAMIAAFGGVQAAASQQGCESSGNTAAGCGGNATATGGAVSNTVTNRNVNRNANRNVNRNLNVQGQDQSQGQSQGQSQTANGGTGIGIGGNQSQSQSSNAAAIAGATNQGVTQGVTVNNTTNAPDSIRTVGQAPDVLTTPTAPCRIGVSASAGWLGGALGIGTSVLDEGCNARENSRLLWNFGLQREAVKVLCVDAVVAEALNETMPNFCVKKEEPIKVSY